MRKKSILTEKQDQVVDLKMEGLSDSAAVMAVYNSKDTKKARTAEVKEAIQEARKEITNATTLKRLDIIEGILGAIDMAKTLSEPATMIAGYDKLAKIIGAYAPEVKQINLTASQEVIRSKFDSMSSEELLALMDGKLVIEGHATRHLSS